MRGARALGRGGLGALGRGGRGALMVASMGEELEEVGVRMGREGGGATTWLLHTPLTPATSWTSNFKGGFLLQDKVKPPCSF